MVVKKVLERIGLKPSRKDSRLPLLFVHVPKTAGTSFRKSAEESKIINTVLCDYGPKSDTTSEEIMRSQYDENSKLKIHEVLKNHSDYMLTGHFPVTRYKKHFYPYEIGIFIRNPLERVLSNFYHKKRMNQFKGSLDKFITSKPAKNLQVRQFGNLPLQFFGFIGISERYDDSISIVNALYNTDLEALKLNTNPSKESDNYDTSDEIKEAIYSQNSKEFEFYKVAQTLFEKRLQFKHIKYPLYGSWHITDDKKIKGRAYRAYSNESVELVMLINGKVHATTKADARNPLRCDVKQPNDGFIGFEFNLDKAINAESEIIVQAADTGEPLFKT